MLAKNYSLSFTSYLVVAYLLYNYARSSSARLLAMNEFIHKFTEKVYSSSFLGTTWCNGGGFYKPTR